MEKHMRKEKTMNTNKEILTNIAKTLEESATTSWTSGGFEEWSRWARKMRDTINSVIPNLRTVSNNQPKFNSTAPLHPSDKEVESWFETNVGENCSASSAIYKFRLWLKDRELENKN